MDKVSKKRIIGALALVFAGIVLLPLLFDGEGYRERQLTSNIPPAPAIPVATSIEQQHKPLPDTQSYPEAVVPEQPAVAEVTAPKPAVKKPKVVAPPVLDEQNVPVAWTLQLASFKDEANARSLRKQLVAAGHKVYTRKSAKLVKVYVGPDAQRERLEKLKARLQKDFGLDGILVRFTTQ